MFAFSLPFIISTPKLIHNKTLRNLLIWSVFLWSFQEGQVLTDVSYQCISLWSTFDSARLSRIQMHISCKICIMLLLMTITHNALFLQNFVFKAVCVSTIDILHAWHPCKRNSAELSKYHNRTLERWVKPFYLISQHLSCCKGKVVSTAHLLN